MTAALLTYGLDIPKTHHMTKHSCSGPLRIFDTTLVPSSLLRLAVYEFLSHGCSTNHISSSTEFQTRASRG